jgi:hypothetical protein
VIWPKTDHFGHFYQERYLLDDFLMILFFIVVFTPLATFQVINTIVSDGKVKKTSVL